MNAYSDKNKDNSLFEDTMSGHNKWSKIKRQKGIADIKKGKIFSKLSKVITLTAKNGGDPGMNPALSLAIDKAKQVNMPSDNIEKAIKKGTGELAGGAIEEVLFEAYGPEGIALIIEGMTDNNNRTVAEIKHALSKNGGRLGEAGSVKWMFDRFGYMEIEKESLKMGVEDLEMAAIEAGAEDIADMEDMVVVYTKPENLYSVKSDLEKIAVMIGDSGFEWRAKNKVKIEDPKINDRIDNLFAVLDEQEDVTEVYSNVED
ncbi:MAG: YebC/PmpR family DNA-binding transcriptional regulator [Candidatus Pacebacteria bacterium]|nr:YebC/PmpR family DNA-binding transcriptional regulator [Candidatus Paceibacterota bacterium]